MSALNIVVLVLFAPLILYVLSVGVFVVYALIFCFFVYPWAALMRLCGVKAKWLEKLI